MDPESKKKEPALPAPIEPIDAKAEEIKRPGLWAEMKAPILVLDPEKLAQLRKIYDDAQRKKLRGKNEGQAPTGK